MADKDLVFDIDMSDGALMHPDGRLVFFGGRSVLCHDNEQAKALGRELSGARRARERAEEIVRQCGRAEDRDQGQQAAMECAQDILEAFDGE